MKKLIFLKNYNNYFNRKIIREKKISPGDIVHQLNNPSFNMNDGIRTSQIVNANVSKCDYAIFCDDTSLVKHNYRKLVEEEISNIVLNTEYLIEVGIKTRYKRNSTFITSSNDNIFTEYYDNSFEEAKETINFNQMEIIQNGNRLITGNKPVTINLYQIENGETILKSTFTTEGERYFAFKFVKAYAEIGASDCFNTISGKIENDSYYTIDNPDSRWFILEAVKQRTGQYLVGLKRDVIVDNINFIENAPMFIEKGTLDDSDPMIYNDEGMVFNKIKIEESLIKGSSFGSVKFSSNKLTSAWIVGYVIKDEIQIGGKTASSISVTPYQSSSQYPSISEASTITGISETDLSSIISSGQFGIISTDFNVNFGQKEYLGLYPTSKGQITYLDFNSNITNPSVNVFESWGSTLYTYKSNNPKKYGGIGIISLLFERANDLGYYNDIKDYYSNLKGYKFITREQYEKLKSLQGINYNDSDYLLTFNQQSSGVTEDSEFVLTDTTNAKLKQALTELKNEGYIVEIFDEGEVFFNTNKLVKINITKEVNSTTSYNIPLLPASKRSCVNSPCDIFVIPYNDVYFKGPTQTISQNINMVYQSHITINNILKIASELATQLGSQLYDIQLVPFVDLPKTTGFNTMKILQPDGTTKTVTTNYQDIVDIVGTAGVYSSYITQGTYNVSFIYWLTSPSFSITSNEYIPDSVKTITEPKIKSQTQMCRIVSPTGQGMFDFNPAKNGGLESYRINCTLKPYAPYIQILPMFKNLYGDDFNDYRGLICSGDFSLSRVQDQWIEYQLQNKNYQNIFNREIQNLDFNQRLEAKYQPLSIATGALTATGAGAIGGAMTGLGIGGAVAGGIGAGVSSLVGGIADYQIADQKRAETKNYAKDRFNYQLGNIKAVPDSITKVGTFVVNSKIFPFFELYDCTEEEKQALRNKITYDGMTVNRIGTISEFEGGDDNQKFVKGQIIRLDDIMGDNHIANEIYDELLKGVYI